MRLIDADSIKYRYAKLKLSDGTETHGYFAFVTSLEIEEAPTIEAEPVQHGEWVPIYQTLYNKHGASQIATEWSCSQCGCLLTDRRNYCPNCGAKLEGGKRE